MDWWDNPVTTTDGTASSPESWAERACLGSDLVLWYGPPEDGPGSYEESDDQRLWRERRAMQICTTCPVIAQCLAAEQLHGAVDGDPGDAESGCEIGFCR